MDFRTLFKIALAVFPATAFSDPGLVYRYSGPPEPQSAVVVGVVDLVPADTKRGSGCEQRIASLTIDEVLYEGESDDVIGFRAEKPNGDGIAWRFTMDTEALYQSLSNYQRHDLKTLIKKGQEIVATYQICGSGGYISVRDVFLKSAINNP